MRSGGCEVPQGMPLELFGLTFRNSPRSSAQAVCWAASSLWKKKISITVDWLVVSTHLKNISQNGNLPQIGVKIKNIWNHHLVDDGTICNLPFYLKAPVENFRTTFAVIVTNPASNCLKPQQIRTPREPQHTPGAYPRPPQTPKWKEFLHKVLAGVSGVCSGGMLENSWKFLDQRKAFLIS